MSTIADLQRKLVGANTVSFYAYFDDLPVSDPVTLMPEELAICAFDGGDAAEGTIYVPQSGRYLIFMSIGLVEVAFPGTIYGLVFKNGSQQIANIVGGQAYSGQIPSGVAVVDLEAGDYLQAAVFNKTEGNLTYAGTDDNPISYPAKYTSFGGIKIN